MIDSEGLPTLHRLNAVWARLGVVGGTMLLCAVGAILVALGMNAARASYGIAEPLYWAGLLTIFVPVAVRLATASPTNGERVALLVGLGLWLYAVKVMLSPVQLVFYDELLHMRTVADIVSTSRLFAENPLLPVSPYYPGMEDAAVALVQITGLPLVDGATLLMGAARVLAVMALFLLYERVAGSSRVAGLATLVYVTNPAFLYFDKQFAYESLALPLALLLIWGEVRRQNEPGSARYAFAGMSGLLLVAIIVTHHLTSYALSAFLVLWSLAWLWNRSRKWTQVSSDPRWLTGAVILGTLLWLLVVARVTVAYFGGNLLATAREIVALIGGETEMRSLFQGSAGDVAPVWERLAGYGAALGVLALLPSGLLALWRRYRESALAVAFGVAALAYPVTLGLRLTSFGLQLAGRTPEFLFLPLGFVLSAALLTPGGSAGLMSAGHRAHAVRQTLFLVWITVLFVGGVVLGWPRWGRLPGTYLTVADSRSIDAQSVAAATWAGQQLEPHQRIAADRVSAALWLAYGEQDPVTASYGGIAVPELYFAERLGARELAIIRQGEISYIVIDRRIAEGPPEAGVYFEPGERAADEITVPVGQYLAEGLETLQGVDRVFDSGSIVVYRVGGTGDAP